MTHLKWKKKTLKFQVNFLNPFNRILAILELNVQISHYSK